MTQDSVLGSIDTPLSLHRYTYVMNAPTRFVDLDGNDAVLIENANGGETLVIPVKFVGQDATAKNVELIVEGANTLKFEGSVSKSGNGTASGSRRRVLVVPTAVPLFGNVFNTLDVSAGKDPKCGPRGVCVYVMGGREGHVDSVEGYSAGPHEVLHFAGFADKYDTKDPKGRQLQVIGEQHYGGVGWQESEGGAV